ncbi:MAG: glycogen/starch/alpha-glucan phosphorylase [Desulfobacteraceae bacterium]|nr:MAG: glycogen/starch/alpha-glucan phosphorylase [Desulfobacteraceae bacterium]
MSYFDFTGFEHAVRQYVNYELGKDMAQTSRIDQFFAVSSAVNRFVMDVGMQTRRRYLENDVKRMYYVSMEFLIGRLLSNNLLNLGILSKCRDHVGQMGWDFDAIIEEEHDPALGNGGLGRLAACFLDSLASLDMPGFGYGINYDYGLFKQRIVNGYQREKPDYWPNRSSNWLIRRYGNRILIPIYGRIEDTRDTDGEYNPMWVDWSLLVGRPHDIFIAGYGGRTANRLRLFSAWASEEFDMQIFNEGDYFKAVEDKIKSESISKILYPSDSQESGQELRLVQEYFLVACSVHDIIRIFQLSHDAFDRFHEKVAIQMNDTHPALTVAELMRTLVDEHALPWEQAWKITTLTLGYTNHTLLPEALETWPLHIVEKVIPRHLQIIYEINSRFIKELRQSFPDMGEDTISRLSIIQEGNFKQVRMANLAIIGSHSVNGVARIHSELVKTQLVPDFYTLYPHKFNNKTNGVTPRRWIALCNPDLADLISEAIGDRWIADLERIQEVERYVDDREFVARFMAVKHKNKEKLGQVIKSKSFVRVNPEAIFDIHAKRIHEYKRQLLNVMNIIHMYLSLKDDGNHVASPRVFVFAGKAAPGYKIAKLIIKLIHDVARVINNDPDIREQIRVAFIPDYRVTHAERIIPAADVSEQISTAGMEASGTGNMKFAMNGAVTLGTMDGANIEISERVGRDNIYIFGHTVEGILKLRQNYSPRSYLENDSGLKRVIEALASDLFNKKEPGLYTPLVDTLVNHGDFYCHIADFSDYCNTQLKIGIDYQDAHAWGQKALRNTARTGWFSSDRTINEYAAEIWGIQSQI